MKHCPIDLLEIPPPVDVSRVEIVSAFEVKPSAILSLYGCAMCLLFVKVKSPCLMQCPNCHDVDA